MASPMPTIGLCLAYVCLVKWAGPCLMKRRQPFNIRTVMVVYNFAMVLLSLYLFVKLGIYGWFGSYNYRCQPVDYSQESIEVKETKRFRVFTTTFSSFIRWPAFAGYTFLVSFWNFSTPSSLWLEKSFRTFPLCT